MLKKIPSDLKIPTIFLKNRLMRIFVCVLIYSKTCDILEIENGRLSHKGKNNICLDLVLYSRKEKSDMKYLIAIDMEGIHGVVGEPYTGLTRQLPDYKVATENGALEVNAAVRALFDNGATEVAVWDNHGGGGNLDFEKIDPRVTKIDSKGDKLRFDFARDRGFSGIVYLGYHAREGTLGAVLAHTYNSVAIQYVRLDGRDVGELELDTYIAATLGIAPIFSASDDICNSQFTALAPEAVTVTTKYARGRNAAEFKDEGEVLREIYDGVALAVKKNARPISYPVPAHAEIRYTRMEDAAEMLERAHRLGIECAYGTDAHILEVNVNKISEIVALL